MRCDSTWKKISLLLAFTVLCAPHQELFPQPLHHPADLHMPSSPKNHNFSRPRRPSVHHCRWTNPSTAAAEVIGSLGFDAVFSIHIQPVYTVFVRRRKPSEPTTSAAAVDGFVHLHLSIDGHGAEGNLWFLVEGGVYRTPAAMAEK